MSSINKILLIGTISSPVDQRIGSDGQESLSFQLSVPRSFQSIGQDESDVFKVVIFGQSVERSKDACVEGRQLLVEGRISTRSYDDENGKRHWVTEIQAFRVREQDSASAPAINASSFAATPAPSNLNESSAAAAPSFQFDNESENTEILEEEVPF